MWNSFSSLFSFGDVVVEMSEQDDVISAIMKGYEDSLAEMSLKYSKLSGDIIKVKGILRDENIDTTKIEYMIWSHRYMICRIDANKVCDAVCGVGTLTAKIKANVLEYITLLKEKHIILEYKYLNNELRELYNSLDSFGKEYVFFLIRERNNLRSFLKKVSRHKSSRYVLENICEYGEYKSLIFETQCRSILVK